MNPRGTMVPGDFLCNEGSVLDAVLYLGDAGALNFYRIGKKKMLHRQKNRGSRCGTEPTIGDMWLYVQI